jgi:hypothetical protein
MQTDPRILNLSYSSLLTLHNCPRKFQLYKLGSVRTEEDDSSSVTFATGHCVGTGIQNILKGLSQEEVLWEAFLEWEPDLFAENTKHNKSFFKSLHALNQFRSIYENNYLDGYELVQYANEPACELSFSIELPDGFVYRGFVDAVLQHRITGKVLVLEVKTTNEANVNPAKYKNSAQAIGYSIVLDTLFPTLSAYEVLYLIYQTKSEEYQQIPFEKSYYQRALWIRELLLDIEMIKLYEEAQIYPMHGESCYAFFRECEYYSTCTLSTANLTEKLTPAGIEKLEADAAKYQIRITLADLINSQLAKESANVSDALPTTSSTAAATSQDILL